MTTTKAPNHLSDIPAAYANALGMMAPTEDGFGVATHSEDVWTVRTGGGVMFANGVVTGAESPDPAAVHDAAKPFVGTNLQWSVQLRQPPTPEMESVIQDLGLRVRSSIPLMTIEEPPTATGGSFSATVKMVDPSQRPQFLEAMSDGFGLESASLENLLTTFGLDPNVRAYAFEQDGRIATTGLTTFDGVWTGVFDIATRPAYRKRGYGHSLTERMVLDAFASDARGAFLQASDLGRPIYERVGFRLFESWTYCS